MPGPERRRRNRLILLASVALVLGAAVLIVLGALAISDRVANEAIERAPIPRSTSTPLPTAPPVAVTAAPTAAVDVDLFVTTPMPHPERQFAMSVLLADGRVLVVGGDPPRRYGDAFVSGIVSPLNSALIYDPAADRWSEVTPPPTQRSFGRLLLGGDGSALTVGGIGFGPFGGGLAGNTVIDRYDWLTDTWSRIAAPARANFLTIVESQGRIYGIGRRELQRYDLTANEWIIVATIDEEYSVLAGLVLADGRLLLSVATPSREVFATEEGTFATGAIPPAEFGYVVLDPRTGNRSDARFIPGPPYRPTPLASADGAVVLVGGFAEDPTEYDRALAAMVRAASPPESPASEPEAESVQTPTPPLRNDILYRLDLDSGELAMLSHREPLGPSSLKLPGGQTVSAGYPELVVTEAGGARLAEALDGRIAPIVLALDDSHVLVAGGASSTAEVDALLESLAVTVEDFGGEAFLSIPPDVDIEAAITAAGLDALEARVAPLDTVIVRVN